MASLNMGNHYPLTSQGIDNAVTTTSAGNYALGYINDEKLFVVEYVGRADSDVKARLKAHLNEGYSCFKFSYATSPKNAFEKECQNYHDFGEKEALRNSIHPDRPSNSKQWKCPSCTIFG
ncbi:hypothetical protein LF935_06210 [Pectobacterium carotovorum]|uniref:hypothetical protein n=1 Tax=Pectobacterium TaxID=122277 RepID=UPI000CD0A39B|nr:MULTISPECIES: hypothetical protein [Pectobacterium]MCA6969226.1 hypothetical protein [Pectobacterium carotovorum]POE18459.1 hypothetical protein BV923_21300 [Pectobacterium odoriferum]